ncbi:MAG: hypothetical protein WC012_08925 [Thiohalomonadaceae bacterium]
MSIISDIATGLRIALRARFLSLAFWFLLALAASIWLAAQFSGRQPATVGLDVGFSIIRLVLPLVIVLLLQELFVREFDRRYSLTSLTYPRPRQLFFIGRVLAALVLILLLLALAGLLVAGMVALVGQSYEQTTQVGMGGPYLTTLLFIALDLFVITGVAALLSVVASTPSFILIGTFGFALAARSYAAIVDLLTTDAYLVSNAESYRHSLALLRYILPDLGALDIRMTALYNTWRFLPSDWPLLLVGAFAYGVAFLLLAGWILNRKRFS